MNEIHVGIMPRDAFQKRLIDIAAGRYKPAKDEPKVWFSSIKSLAEVLSENNLRLLKIIDEQKPPSIKALAVMTNRKPNNLSRTLKTMARYGIVELKKVGRVSKPVVKVTDFNIHYGVSYSS